MFKCPMQIDNTCWCPKYRKTILDKMLGIPEEVHLMRGKVITLSWIEDFAEEEVIEWGSYEEMLNNSEDVSISDILGGLLDV